MTWGIGTTRGPVQFQQIQGIILYQFSETHMKIRKMYFVMKTVSISKKT